MILKFQQALSFKLIALGRKQAKKETPWFKRKAALLGALGISAVCIGGVYYFYRTQDGALIPSSEVTTPQLTDKSGSKVDVPAGVPTPNKPLTVPTKKPKGTLPVVDPKATAAEETKRKEAAAQLAAQKEADRLAAIAAQKAKDSADAEEAARKAEEDRKAQEAKDAQAAKAAHEEAVKRAEQKVEKAVAARNRKWGRPALEGEEKQKLFDAILREESETPTERSARLADTLARAQSSIPGLKERLERRRLKTQMKAAEKTGKKTPRDLHKPYGKTRYTSRAVESQWKKFSDEFESADATFSSYTPRIVLTTSGSSIQSTQRPSRQLERANIRLARVTAAASANPEDVTLQEELAQAVTNKATKEEAFLRASITKLAQEARQNATRKAELATQRREQAEAARIRHTPKIELYAAEHARCVPLQMRGQITAPALGNLARALREERECVNKPEKDAAEALEMATLAEEGASAAETALRALEGPLSLEELHAQFATAKEGLAKTERMHHAAWDRTYL
ncbi:MAG: hypothetical protein QG604_317 [Candidatus Dependentiae bacterium]|nr:hypothetical protein [Candidatus Dependentiae bacterium]